MSFLEKENHNGLRSCQRSVFEKIQSISIASHLNFFTILAFYPKAVDFFNQAGLLARSSQSHPSQIASVDLT